MALQLSKHPYHEADNRAVNQVGPGYTWHIDKNVVDPVALAMLPALTGPIAQRGLLVLVCNASSVAPYLRSFAAAAAAQAILRHYYYKVEQASPSKMLFHAIVEGLLEANDMVAHEFWPDAEQRNSLTLTENFAGLSATAVVAQGNKIVIGSVGDTCAYRVRNGKLAPYEQSQPKRLIILEDAFRKGDRVLLCTQALAATNGMGRIRAAANAKLADSPAALHALIDAANPADTDDVLAVAMLYRNATQPAAARPLMLQRPAGSATPPPTPRITRWVTLVSLLFVFLAAGLLIFEGQRSRLATKPSATSTVIALPPVLTTRLVSVPVLIGADDSTAPSITEASEASISDTKTLSVVITTSEPGKVVFQLAATETPALEAAVIKPTPTPRPTAQALRAKATRANVSATSVAKPEVTIVPPQPTPLASQATSVPAPEPTSVSASPPLPPQPTSPPPQPTSPPPQPTSPPPQPTSPPPQPTSPPPQPTSPPPQPTSVPPQPTPELAVPCLPGDAQCKP